MYGLFESEFGSGITGGRLYRNVEVGERSARTAVRILQGEKAESMPPELLEPSVPQYDGRELKRWGISEANLPAGSRVEFRQPGFLGTISWAGGRGAGLHAASGRADFRIVEWACHPWRI